MKKLAVLLCVLALLFAGALTAHAWPESFTVQSEDGTREFWFGVVMSVSLTEYPYHAQQTGIRMYEHGELLWEHVHEYWEQAFWFDATQEQFVFSADLNYFAFLGTDQTFGGNEIDVILFFENGQRGITATFGEPRIENHAFDPATNLLNVVRTDGSTFTHDLAQRGEFVARNGIARGANPDVLAGQGVIVFGSGLLSWQVLLVIIIGVIVLVMFVLLIILRRKRKDAHG